MRKYKIVLITLLIVNLFSSVAFTQNKTFAPSGSYYEFGGKDGFDITGNDESTEISESNALGTLFVSGNINDQGSDVYHVQSENVSVFYSIDVNSLESATDQWHLIEEKTKTIDDFDLNENILKGAIVVQSSLDGKNWLVEEVYTDVFSGKVNLTDSLFKTKNIQQMNGSYYRVIVAYTLEKLVGKSNNFFGENDKFDYMKVAEVYQFYVIDQNTVDNKTASPSRKPRKEFKEKVNTSHDNGFDVSKAKEIDKDDPHFGWDLGVFTVNGYTRESTQSDGTAVFLKTLGDDITLWFTLNQDINRLDGNESLFIEEDTNGYDKALGIKQTNFKHGTLIIKYTDEEGHSPDSVIYTDFLRANTMTGANTRIQLYEEGEYEVTLNYVIQGKNGLFNAFKSFNDYKMTFKFAIRNGNTMAFTKDILTSSELKDGALTTNGFSIDLAESKYLTIDVVRKEVVQNADGTLTTIVRNNSIAANGDTYTKEGIYEITVKNLYSDGKPNTTILYVGSNKNITAIARNRLTVDKLNEYIRSGTTIGEDGTLINAPKETLPIVAAPAEKPNDSKTNNDSNLIPIAVVAVLVVIVIGVTTIVQKRKS